MQSFTGLRITVQFHHKRFNKEARAYIKKNGHAHNRNKSNVNFYISQGRPKDQVNVQHVFSIHFMLRLTQNN